MNGIISPAEIEKRSFEIISEMLEGRCLDPENEAVIKRAVHTTADLDYAENLVFSDHAVSRGIEALKAGCCIVTDTQMAKAGINKAALARLGGEVFCFMSDEDVAAEAKTRGVTRASVSMEKAAKLERPCIFAIGNAPTALLRIKELMDEGRLSPALIIGVPVGFVNVAESKERIIEGSGAPFIVARGRKGGSNVAAAICNALLYQIGNGPREQYVVKGGKSLRLGYTTGTCAAAASKAAALMLLTGKKLENISVVTPRGISLKLELADVSISEDRVSCAIKKDSGDDPDVTDGILIYSEVSRTKEPGIVIEGGKGIGRVTMKGLDRPVGDAAINSGPRKQIAEALTEVLSMSGAEGGLKAVISAPEGEELAKKTFNPRLGIVGGISILGTTGIVDPMSEDALIETVRISLRQKREMGAEYALLTPGNIGAEYIKSSLRIPPETAVPVSNYIGESLDMCIDMGFKGVLIVGHVGKLVKLAGGLFNTHSKYGDCRMEILASCAGAEGLSPGKISEVLGCVTCDGALEIIKDEGLLGPAMKRLEKKIAFMLENRTKGALKTGAMVFSGEFGLLLETENAPVLLKHFREEA
ncbi:MAG: cobalamin biosynthesis protein CbiD [Firmicutes bacterium]|nr:cobalamin biosynthesis protein CbiD [Bacillota bacterium]